MGGRGQNPSREPPRKFTNPQSKNAKRWRGGRYVGEIGKDEGGHELKDEREGIEGAARRATLRKVETGQLFG